MTIFSKTNLVAIVTLGALGAAARADEPMPTPRPAAEPIRASAPAAPGCALPVTRSYKIQPTFCVQKLVALVPQAVGNDGCCGDCGPYGIPPIYAVGPYLMVRQTPEVQERVVEFLTNLGALVPSRKLSTYDPKS